MWGSDSRRLGIPKVGTSRIWGLLELWLPMLGLPELRVPGAGVPGAGCCQLPQPPPCLPPCLAQALVLEQAAQGSGPPDLRMQYLRQIQANHEVSPPIPSLPAGTPPPTRPSPPAPLPQMLLKEAQTLRDQPPLSGDGAEGSATATEKLLDIYRQLRNPSLVLL